MKRLAILIVLVLVVAGAGGAGWWFFLRETPTKEAAAEAEAEVEAGTAMSATPQSFVKLAPMNLPVLREGQVILHLTVELSVELAQPMTPDRIRATTPRLRDALLSELHALFAYRHVQERGYDIPVVKTRLVQAGERVLGAGEVRSVLIQNITQRSPKAG